MVGLGFMVWGVCFRVSSGLQDRPKKGGFTEHRGPVGISLVRLVLVYS